MPMFTRDTLEYILALASEDNYTKLEGKALLRLEDGSAAVIAAADKVVVVGGYNARKPGNSAVLRAAETLLPLCLSKDVTLAVLTNALIDALFERPIGEAARVTIRPTEDGGVDTGNIVVEWMETR